MTDRLLVGVVGHSNAGKSSTWEDLFGATVKTSHYGNERRLYLSKNQKDWVNVFPINGSPGERGKDVKEILNPKSLINFENPRIVLCSMEYPNDAVGATIQYFIEHKYELFIHWLNPGYKDPEEYDDLSGFIPYILKQHNSLLGIRDGKTDRTSRVNEIRNFIRGWASARGLINTDKPICV
ncbi:MULTISPECIES: hypothetical protein [Nostocales]|uniref:G domain-containing protein n=3 Tax=Nostocales TaxID=1161 RepID=A0A0C1R303_9CYAN|nr:hypothetical protein [Tolypothrix bouteillei]KAF3889995.1 hypothetical protein DA73_0400034440 [Tolypothrix bouteillei VB521301]